MVSHPLLGVVSKSLTSSRSDDAIILVFYNSRGPAGY
jgi:hypothetical protein